MLTLCRWFQIRLLIQRVVSSRGEQRIFCLAYGDLLSTEVAQEAEDEIDKYIRGVKGDYRYIGSFLNLDMIVNWKGASRLN